MHRNVRRTAFAALCFAAGAALRPALAQMTTGTLLLSLRDSRTGAAIKTASVRIDGVETASGVDAAGLLSIELGGGRHQVSVEAKGYDGFIGAVTVDGKDTPVNTFELDKATSPSAPGDTLPPDPRVAGIEGYIVDSAAGKLLADARVALPAHNLDARTDADGYFAMSVPVPSATVDGPPVAERITLRASLDGFTPEERRNVEIVSGTTMTITVQLDAATAESEPVKVIEEGRSQHRLHSWRFDVTLD